MGEDKETQKHSFIKNTVATVVVAGLLITTPQAALADDSKADADEHPQVIKTATDDQDSSKDSSKGGKAGESDGASDGSPAAEKKEAGAEGQASGVIAESENPEAIGNGGAAQPAQDKPAEAQGDSVNAAGDAPAPAATDAALKESASNAVEGAAGDEAGRVDTGAGAAGEDDTTDEAVNLDSLGTGDRYFHVDADGDSSEVGEDEFVTSMVKGGKHTVTVEYFYIDKDGKRHAATKEQFDQGKVQVDHWYAWLKPDGSVGGRITKEQYDAAMADKSFHGKVVIGTTMQPVMVTRYFIVNADGSEEEITKEQYEAAMTDLENPGKLQTKVEYYYVDKDGQRQQASEEQYAGGTGKVVVDRTFYQKNADGTRGAQITAEEFEEAVKSGKGKHVGTKYTYVNAEGQEVECDARAYEANPEHTIIVETRYYREDGTEISKAEYDAALADTAHPGVILSKTSYFYFDAQGTRHEATTEQYAGGDGKVAIGHRYYKINRDGSKAEITEAQYQEALKRGYHIDRVKYIESNGMRIYVPDGEKVSVTHDVDGKYYVIDASGHTVEVDAKVVEGLDEETATITYHLDARKGSANGERTTLKLKSNDVIVLEKDDDGYYTNYEGVKHYIDVRHITHWRTSARDMNVIGGQTESDSALQNAARAFLNARAITTNFNIYAVNFDAYQHMDGNICVVVLNNPYQQEMYAAGRGNAQGLDKYSIVLNPKGATFGDLNNEAHVFGKNIKHRRDADWPRVHEVSGETPDEVAANVVRVARDAGVGDPTRISGEVRIEDNLDKLTAMGQSLRVQSARFGSALDATRVLQEYNKGNRFLKDNDVLVLNISAADLGSNAPTQFDYVNFSEVYQRFLRNLETSRTNAYVIINVLTDGMGADSVISLDHSVEGGMASYNGACSKVFFNFGDYAGTVKINQRAQGIFIAGNGAVKLMGGSMDGSIIARNAAIYAECHQSRVGHMNVVERGQAVATPYAKLMRSFKVPVREEQVNLDVEEQVDYAEVEREQSFQAVHAKPRSMPIQKSELFAPVEMEEILNPVQKDVHYASVSLAEEPIGSVKRPIYADVTDGIDYAEVHRHMTVYEEGGGEHRDYPHVPLYPTGKTIVHKATVADAPVVEHASVSAVDAPAEGTLPKTADTASTEVPVTVGFMSALLAALGLSRKKRDER